MHLLSVYAAFLAHTMSRQRVNKQSVCERHMLERFVYTNSTVCRRGEHRIRKSSSFTLHGRARSSSRQITFSFFSTRLTLFVSTLPYHFSLCRLFIISPPPRLHPPFPLSTTRRFLRQVLCTYINSSSVSLRDPLPPSLPSRHSFRGNRLVTRLRRAKQSSKHEETFVLVETRHISTAQPATTFTFTAFRT